jgi:murein DD-endopeptidase MepM/ murein hydrolase activator NlpD
MTYPVPAGKTTGRFNDPSKSGRKGIHGGLDIGAPLGSPIVAPETGSAFAYFARRTPDGTRYWPEFLELHGRGFPFLNYFYDMYGGIIVLKAHNGNPRRIRRTHIFAHSSQRQLFTKPPFGDRERWPIEESAYIRYPIFGWYSEQIIVEEGQTIGHVGNSGFSTGPHVHWEMHEGFTYQKHEERIDPEAWLSGKEIEP